MQKKQYISFKDARDFVRRLSLNSYKEWIDYIKGNRPALPPLFERIPRAPHKVYRDKGWKGWKDWLGYGLNEKALIKKAEDIGLSETEYAFYNILIAALTKHHSNDTIDDNIHKNVITLVRELVEMMEEAMSTVDFFDKQDEQKKVQKKIKRAVLKQKYGTKTLVSAITDRFMELVRAKFKQ